MPLPAKRKTEAKKRQTKTKMGMVSADQGKGPAKNKLDRPIGGLSKDQMKKGADKADEIGKANTMDDDESKPKKKTKKTY